MMFNNGGYALEIMFYHAIVNGPCVWQFVSSWAQVCQGEKQASHCCFDFSSCINVINLKLHNNNLEMTTLMELPQTWKKHELLPHNIFLVCHASLTRPSVPDNSPRSCQETQVSTSSRRRSRYTYEWEGCNKIQLLCNDLCVVMVS